MSDSAIPFGPPPPAIQTQNDDNPVSFIAVNQNIFNLKTTGTGGTDTISQAPAGSKAQFQTLTQDQLTTFLQSDIGKEAAMLGIGIGFTAASVAQKIQDQINNTDPSNPVIPVIMDFLVTTNSMLQEGNAVQALGSTGAAKLTADSITANVTDAVNINSNIGKNAQLVNESTNSKTANAKTNLSANEADQETSSAEEASSSDLDQVTSTTSLAAANTTAAATIVTHANAFFEPSAMVGFYIAMGEMSRDLMQQKEMENKISQITQALIMSMTQDTVSAIYAEHNAQAQAYIVSAIITISTAAASVATTALTIGAGMRMRAEEDVIARDPVTKEKLIEKNPDGSDKHDNEGKPVYVIEKSKAEIAAHNLKMQYGFMGTAMWQGIGSVAEQTGKAVDDIYQAITQGKIATAQAQKETLQSERQLLQSALDKYNQNFDATTKQIEDLWSTFAQMSSALSQMISKMFSR